MAQTTATPTPAFDLHAFDLALARAVSLVAPYVLRVARGHGHGGSGLAWTADLAITSSRIDFGLIEGVTDVLRNVSGDAQINVHIAGTAHDPHFTGAVSLAGAAFLVAGTGSRYKNASADIDALERQLGDLLGLTVRITHKPDGGSVALHYSTLDQLDMICQRLSGERI